MPYPARVSKMGGREGPALGTELLGFLLPSSSRLPHSCCSGEVPLTTTPLAFQILE